MDFEDLVQEGSLGLIRAGEKFDPAHGVKFNTYAGYWIAAYIGRYLKEGQGEGPVHVPRTARAKGFASATAVYIDREVKLKDGLFVPLGDLLDLSSSSSVENEAAASEEAQLLWRQVHCLPSRMREVLEMRFRQEMTLQQIGDAFGVCRERIRQIETEALKMLRQGLEEALAS